MNIKSAAWFSLIGLLTLGCNSKKDRFTDTFTTGVIQIAVDESFQPVMAQEVVVFEEMYPLAGIEPVYVNETDALNLFLSDSMRVAIATRSLSEAEIASFKSRKMFPKDMIIGSDGIALIINPANNDSLISVDQLRNVLAGKIQTWQQLQGKDGADTIQVIFDHRNSSTVRYVMDSICGGEILSAHTFAQNNNPEVINYVASHPNAIGVIGVSWIGEKSDTTGLRFIDKIRVMSVSAAPVATPLNSYKPYQAYVALGDYPLKRNIYALLNDPRGALPTGFYTFLASDRGQRILLKAGIVPATQPVRIVNTRKSF